MTKAQINLPKTAFSMKANLPTREPEILEYWKKINLYDELRNQSKGREKFVLHDGPPYANGNIHMGTALNKILKDIIVKFHQMDGKDSIYVPGWDCHGLPIEWKIEEQYKKNKKNKNEVPIKEFRKECRDFANSWIEVHKKQFKRLIQGLYELEEHTGVSIRIALEPEPWTRLEKMSEVPDFFEKVVWPAHPYAQKYIGLCYDTCHQALAFEDPHDTWNFLKDRHIPVYKVQISNALRLINPQNEQARQRLLSFNEERYLHQVSALQSDGSILRALDLPHLESLSELWSNATEWRCHFHVPIWWRGDESESGMKQVSHVQPEQEVLGLGTTYQHWETIARCIKDPLAQMHTREGDRLHVEVETYSWHVLPEQLKSKLGLHNEIKKELEALLTILSSS